MPWAELIPILANYTLPAVKYIVEKIAAGQNVTPAEIDELIALEKRSAKDEMLAVMADQKIDPNSDLGKSFLALVS